MLGSIGTAIFYFGMIVAVLVILLIASVFSFIPIVAFILSVVVGLAVAFGTLWLFFLRRRGSLMFRR